MSVKGECATHIAVVLFLLNAVIVVGHNFYWIATRIGVITLGSVFSTVQVFHLISLTLDAWKHTQIEELAEESRETGRQQFVMGEVGLFLPVINYYEHATFFAGGHVHGAMSGMKRNIALGSILFYLYVIIKPEGWCSIFVRTAFLEPEWRHLLDDDAQHVARWFVPVLPEHPLWPVVCTLRCHCQGRDDPESREDALCRQKPLRLVRYAATYMLHLLSLVHDEGGDFDQEQRRNRLFLADHGGSFAAAVKPCCARTGGLSLVRATALAGGSGDRRQRWLACPKGNAAVHNHSGPRIGE